MVNAEDLLARVDTANHRHRRRLEQMPEDTAEQAAAKRAVARALAFVIELRTVLSLSLRERDEVLAELEETRRQRDELQARLDALQGHPPDDPTDPTGNRR
ncbi:hypothetical protein [Thermomonospora cellulosilytica]|uniref:Uncharacterized protein n=1 Tax=Thermomonospora cellulosilytica TaxID=1411118 RepID=A0A7W3N1P8_9ACTN|nr:hypothetical protein [Thermomonospora cellulosilytica]MBA9005854.1 hypothetical protein [Thermomonospora cellulosilytica]